MTIYEFAKLTNDEKATTTLNGTFLAHREKDSLKYALYAVEDFFVEVPFMYFHSQINRLMKQHLSDINLNL